MDAAGALSAASVLGVSVVIRPVGKLYNVQPLPPVASNQGMQNRHTFSRTKMSEFTRPYRVYCPMSSKAKVTTNRLKIVREYVTDA